MVKIIIFYRFHVFLSVQTTSNIKNILQYTFSSNGLSVKDFTEVSQVFLKILCHCFSHFPSG